MAHGHHPCSSCLIGMLAPDGRCKTLDEAGNGYVRAEDCVVLVLDVFSFDLAIDTTAIVHGSAVRQVCSPLSRNEEVHITSLMMSTITRSQYCGLFFSLLKYRADTHASENSAQMSEEFSLLNAGWPFKYSDGPQWTLTTRSHTRCLMERPQGRK